MNKKPALDELRIKSFRTGERKTLGGFTTPTACPICTSPHPICNSVDNYTICDICFP